MWCCTMPACHLHARLVVVILLRYLHYASLIAYINESDSTLAPLASALMLHP